MSRMSFNAMVLALGFLLTILLLKCLLIVRI